MNKFFSLLLPVLISSLSLSHATGSIEDVGSSKNMLRFTSIKNYESQCDNLKNWLISEFELNPKAKSLLQLSLKRGDLKVVLTDQLHNYGNYNPSSRTINLLVDFSKINSQHLERDIDSIKEFLSSSSVPSIQDQISKFYINHILRVLIFELGNSINDSVLSIYPRQFPFAENYARTMEIAEFKTQELTIPIFKHGVEHCGWNEQVFKCSDLETLRNIAYHEKDDHYKLYINQYNKNWMYNKFFYYLSYINIFSYLK